MVVPVDGFVQVDFEVYGKVQGRSGVTYSLFCKACWTCITGKESGFVHSILEGWNLSLLLNNKYQ